MNRPGSRAISILLISKKTDSAVKLHQDLIRNSNYHLRFEETADEAMTLLTSGQFDCAIFNFEKFGVPQARLIQGIRQVTKVFQIVVFAESTEESAVLSARQLEGVAIIEKRLLNLERDMTGLCERIIGGGEAAQRSALRHPTDQRVRVEILATGRYYDGHVRDITEKGACIELGTNILKVGEQVKLTIELEKLNRQHVVMAEVRWSKAWPGHGIFGVRFATS